MLLKLVNRKEDRVMVHEYRIVVCFIGQSDMKASSACL